MNYFEYKNMFVRYSPLIKDNFNYSLVNNDGKVLLKDYIQVGEGENIKNKITNYLDSLFATQKVGIFRYEICFTEDGQTSVIILLPDNNILTDNFVITEKSISKLTRELRDLFAKNLVYSGYKILDFTTITGYVKSDKNIIAIKVLKSGKFDVIYAQNSNELKFVIDNKNK